jgi:predicted KAP-like P-loop ATPase
VKGALGMNKQDIEQKFYNLLRSNITILEFEEWVYKVDEELLSKYFGNDLYFELISQNYKDKHVMNELETLLFSNVPFGRFEEIKIRELLEQIINDKGILVEIIEEFYDLYCDGYNFLRYIGLAYVFHGMPRENETYNFTDQTRKNLKSEAKRILSFLDNRKIIITDEYEYEDLREEADKIELHSLEKMYINS